MKKGCHKVYNFSFPEHDTQFILQRATFRYVAPLLKFCRRWTRLTTYKEEISFEFFDLYYCSIYQSDYDNRIRRLWWQIKREYIKRNSKIENICNWALVQIAKRKRKTKKEEWDIKRNSKVHFTKCITVKSRDMIPNALGVDLI